MKQIYIIPLALLFTCNLSMHVYGATFWTSQKTAPTKTAAPTTKTPASKTATTNSANKTATTNNYSFFKPRTTGSNTKQGGLDIMADNATPAEGVTMNETPVAQPISETQPKSFMTQAQNKATSLVNKAKSSLGLQKTNYNQKEIDLGSNGGVPVKAEVVSIDGVPIAKPIDLGSNGAVPVKAEVVSIDGIPIAKPIDLGSNGAVPVKAKVVSIDGVPIAKPDNNPAAPVQTPGNGKPSFVSSTRAQFSRLNPFAKSTPKTAAEAESTNESTVKNKDGSSSKSVTASDGTVTTTTTYPLVRNPFSKNPNLAVTTKSADGKTTTVTTFTDGSKTMNEIDASGVQTISEYTGNKPLFGSSLQTKTFKQIAETVIKPDPDNPGKTMTTKIIYDANELPVSQITTDSSGNTLENVTISYTNGKPIRTYHGNVPSWVKDEAQKDNSQATPQQILGVGANATPEEITIAYRNLARTFHPDKNQSPLATQKMQVINEAYKTALAQSSSATDNPVKTSPTNQNPQSAAPQSAAPQSAAPQSAAPQSPASTPPAKPSTDTKATPRKPTSATPNMADSPSPVLETRGNSGFSLWATAID